MRTHNIATIAILSCGLTACSSMSGVDDSSDDRTISITQVELRGENPPVIVRTTVSARQVREQEELVRRRKLAIENGDSEEVAQVSSALSKVYICSSGQDLELYDNTTTSYSWEVCLRGTGSINLATLLCSTGVYCKGNMGAVLNDSGNRCVFTGVPLPPLWLAPWITLYDYPTTPYMQQPTEYHVRNASEVACYYP